MVTYRIFIPNDRYIYIYDMHCHKSYRTKMFSENDKISTLVTYSDRMFLNVEILNVSIVIS